MSQPVCILCAYYHPKAETHLASWSQPGRQCCSAGLRRLEHELVSLRAAFQRLQEGVGAEPAAKDAVSQLLPGAPVPSPSNQPSVSGTKERRLPIDVTRVDLLLPAGGEYVRDPNRDQTGNLSVATVLNEWVAAWHDRFYSSHGYPRTDAISLIDWISGHRLYWVAEHDEAITDFAEEIRDLRSLLAGALGEVEKIPVTMWGVPCPKCQLVSQLELNPEDPDHYRICISCGAMLSRTEYMEHLRSIVDQHRS